MTRRNESYISKKITTYFIFQNTIQEISSQFLYHHEKQAENIQGFFVMTSQQLYILRDEDLEASKIFIENKVNLYSIRAMARPCIFIVNTEAVLEC